MNTITNVRTNLLTIKHQRPMLRRFFQAYTPESKRQDRSPASFCRINLSLASCSSAELASVSIDLCKNQTNDLYLQLVKKGSHLPLQSFVPSLNNIKNNPW